MIIPWIGIDLDGTLAKYDRWRGDEHYRGTNTTYG